MTSDPETLAWAAFGSSALALMGLSLAADAPTHARAAMQFSGAGGARKLVWAYRAAGLLFFAAAAYAARRGLAEPVHLDRASRLGLGALLGAAALARAFGQWASRPARLPTVLESDSLLEEQATPGRRVARAAAWLLTLDLAAFACYLVRP